MYIKAIYSKMGSYCSQLHENICRGVDVEMGGKGSLKQNEHLLIHTDQRQMIIIG